MKWSKQILSEKRTGKKKQEIVLRGSYTQIAFALRSSTFKQRRGDSMRGERVLSDLRFVVINSYKIVEVKGVNAILPLFARNYIPGIQRHEASSSSTSHPLPHSFTSSSSASLLSLRIDIVSSACAFAL